MLRSMMQDARYTVRQWRRAAHPRDRHSYGGRRSSVSTPGLALRRAVVLIAIGLTLGGVLAWFAARFAGSYIYGVHAHNALTFAAVTVVLAASSFLAAWLPARRAVAVDPILALRSE